MKLNVMIVVGLIMALASLAGSEDINFEPFKSDNQIADYNLVNEQLGLISGEPNGFGLDNKTSAVINTNDNSLLNKEVNNNLGDIINSGTNGFDTNLPSNKDFQMEISNSFGQVIPGSISDSTPALNSITESINDIKDKFMLLIDRNKYENDPLNSNISGDISPFI